MTGSPTTAVVIVSKDEPLLEGTLNALREQLEDNDAECVVVDASRRRLDRIRQTHPWVHWIDFVGPLGVPITIAHQRNVGVRAASAPVIAFCDCGGVPGEKWLASLTAPILAGTAEATCGPIYNLDSPFMGAINDLADGAPVRVTVTANMAVARSAFDSVGGFDERFACGEDTEFGWRLRDARLRVVCAASATMSMHWGDADREILRGRRYGQGTAMLFLTHPDRIPEHVAMWPDLLAYPVWFVGLPISLALIPVSGWIPVGWAALLAVPVVRALLSGNPVAFLRVKWVRTLGFFAGLAHAIADRGVPVLLVGASAPSDPHTPSEDQLREVQVPTARVDATRRRLVARLCWRRLRGARIIDLRGGVPGSRRARRRLVVGLWVARRIGYRIVVWDPTEDALIARHADVVVASPERTAGAATAGRARVAVVTRHDIADPNSAATALLARRIYESLLTGAAVDREEPGD